MAVMLNHQNLALSAHPGFTAVLEVLQNRATHDGGKRSFVAEIGGHCNDAGPVRNHMSCHLSFDGFILSGRDQFRRVSCTVGTFCPIKKGGVDEGDQQLENILGTAQRKRGLQIHDAPPGDERVDGGVNDL